MAFCIENIFSDQGRRPAGRNHKLQVYIAEEVPIKIHMDELIFQRKGSLSLQVMAELRPREGIKNSLKHRKRPTEEPRIDWEKELRKLTREERDRISQKIWEINNEFDM